MPLRQSPIFCSEVLHASQKIRVQHIPVFQVFDLSTNL